MRNYIKLSLAFVVFISLMSFSDSKTTTTKSVVETSVVNDTLTWKMLGDIKYTRKKHATYGEVEFPQVNMKLKTMQKKTVYMSGFIVPSTTKVML